MEKNKLLLLFFIFTLFLVMGLFGFSDNVYAYPNCCPGAGVGSNCIVDTSPCELVGGFNNPIKNFNINVNTIEPVRIYIGTSTNLLSTSLIYKNINFQNQSAGANQFVEIISRKKSNDAAAGFTVSATEALTFPSGGLTINTTGASDGATEGGVVSLISTDSIAYPAWSILKIYTSPAGGGPPGNVTISGSAAAPANFWFGPGSEIKTGGPGAGPGGAINMNSVGDIIGPIGLFDSAGARSNDIVVASTGGVKCLSFGAHATNRILNLSTGSTYFPPFGSSGSNIPLESGPDSGSIMIGTVTPYTYIDLSSSTVSGIDLGLLQVMARGLLDKTCAKIGGTSCYDDLDNKINPAVTNSITVQCLGGCVQGPPACAIPIYDDTPPTAAIEARDKDDALIIDGSIITPIAAATTTFKSVGSDTESGLSLHKVRWSKDNWANVNEVECGTNTNCWVRVGAGASVSFSTTGGASWTSCGGNPNCTLPNPGPFVGGDTVKYYSEAADNASAPTPNIASSTEKTFSVAVAGNNPPTATNLLVSNFDDTVCGEVDYPVVRLNWTFSDADIGDSQTAYQIEIDDNSNFLSPAATTTKINSPTQSVLVDEYSPFSQTLEWNKKYYWRITVWDSADNSSGWIYYIDPTAAPPDTFRTPKRPYPSVDFNPVPYNALLNELVNFNDNSQCYKPPSGPCKTKPVNYDWDFDFRANTHTTDSVFRGDATTTYSAAGLYIVDLKITDEDGYSCSDKRAVNVLNLFDWKEIPPF